MKQNYFTANQPDLGRVIAAAKNRGMSDKDIADVALALIHDRAPRTNSPRVSAFLPQTWELEDRSWEEAGRELRRRGQLRTWPIPFVILLARVG